MSAFLALVYIDSSPIHGRGVFAARDLPAGTDLGLSHLALRTTSDNRTLGVVFAPLTCNDFDDAHDVDNTTLHTCFVRAINHACRPTLVNTAPRRVVYPRPPPWLRDEHHASLTDGALQFWRYDIVLRRDVRRGAELTINYFEEDEGIAQEEHVVGPRCTST